MPEFGTKSRKKLLPVSTGINGEGTGSREVEAFFFQRYFSHGVFVSAGKNGGFRYSRREGRGNKKRAIREQEHAFVVGKVSIRRYLFI